MKRFPREVVCIKDEWRRLVTTEMGWTREQADDFIGQNKGLIEAAINGADAEGVTTMLA